jgi:hypothetical protein
MTTSIMHFVHHPVLGIIPYLDIAEASNVAAHAAAVYGVSVEITTEERNYISIRRVEVQPDGMVEYAGKEFVRDE